MAKKTCPSHSREPRSKGYTTMNMRFRAVTYQFGGASQSLERHFRELREELLRQGRHFGLLPAHDQWRPPVDTHETPDAIQVKIELAGMREENIDITLYENALVVSGLREDDSEHDESICYHEAQVRYGVFRVEVVLPRPVRADEAWARYENGFLRVGLPKVVASEPGTERPTNEAGHVTSGTSGGHLDASSHVISHEGAVFASPRHSDETEYAPLRRSC